MRVLLLYLAKKLPAGPGRPAVTVIPPAPPLAARQPRRYPLTVLALLGLLTSLSLGCEPVRRPSETALPAPAASKPAAVPKPASAPVVAPAPVALADSAAAGFGHAATKPAGVAGAAAPTPSRPPVKPKGPVLRDTIGNGRAARLLGGPFDRATLRYRRDSGSPLMLKLARRTTLMVGVNSSESRLYRLFSDPTATLTKPLALDRLAFEPGQATLGAEAAQQLGNLAALLHTFPKVQLRLNGHSATTEPQFWKLGNARGRACLAELLKQGIAPARLHTEWLAPQVGDPHPQGLSVRVVAK